MFWCVLVERGLITFFPFPLRALISFQVVDLQVFLLPRITLKPLVPSFPCFANIYVSLMEKVGDCWVYYFPPPTLHAHLNM